MTMFYKTNDIIVIQSEKSFTESVEALRKSSNEWAAKFDGKPVYQNSSSEFRLLGLSLNKNHLSYTNGEWSRPSDKCSNPVALSNKRVKDKELQQQLINDFYETKPKNQISREEFNLSLGTDWANLMLGGLSYFELNGYFYLSSKTTLENCEQITEEEYNQAIKSKRMEK